jgi:hypothetical protein
VDPKHTLVIPKADFWPRNLLFLRLPDSRCAGKDYSNHQELTGASLGELLLQEGSFGGLGSALTNPISRGRRPRSANPTHCVLQIFAAGIGALNGLLESNFLLLGL